MEIRWNMEVVCPTCGGIFKVRHDRKIYCSKKCAIIGNKKTWPSYRNIRD